MDCARRTVLFLLVGLTASSGIVAAQQRIGDFVFVRNTDAMTDEESSYSFTSEVNSTPLREAQLAWACMGTNSIAAMVMVREFVTSGNSARVQWRFDDDPPSGEQLWRAASSTSVVVPPEILDAFTASARAGSRLRVRVWDYQGTPVDLEFSLAGSSRGIDLLPCSGALSDPSPEALERAQEGTPVPPGMKFVGNPNTKKYFATASDCWRPYVSLREAVWFRSLSAARRAGYSESTLCR